jgi:hypothetical protein
MSHWERDILFVGFVVNVLDYVSNFIARLQDLPAVK